MLKTQQAHLPSRCQRARQFHFSRQDRRRLTPCKCHLPVSVGQKSRPGKCQARRARSQLALASKLHADLEERGSASTTYIKIYPSPFNSIINPRRSAVYKGSNALAGCIFNRTSLSLHAIKRHHPAKPTGTSCQRTIAAALCTCSLMISRSAKPRTRIGCGQ